MTTETKTEKTVETAVEPRKVKLMGEDVFSEIKLLAEPRQYKSGINTGKDYYIGTFEGKGFNCEPDFRDAWVKGDIAVVNLVYNKYKTKVVNAEKVDEMIEVDREGWTLTGFATQDQLSKVDLAAANRKLSVKRLTLAYIVEEKNALKEFELTSEQIEELKKA
jgi:hypothetical protein